MQVELICGACAKFLRQELKVHWILVGMHSQILRSYAVSRYEYEIEQF